MVVDCKFWDLSYWLPNQVAVSTGSTVVCIIIIIMSLSTTIVSNSLQCSLYFTTELATPDNSVQRDAPSTHEVALLGKIV